MTGAPRAGYESLHDNAAGILLNGQFLSLVPTPKGHSTHLLRLFIEHLALGRQRIRSINKIVQLLPSLQHRFYCLVLMETAHSLHCRSSHISPSTHQNNLGLVKFLLYAHDGVSLGRILILLKVTLGLREGDGGWLGEGGLGDFGGEIVEKLRQ